MEGMYVAFGCHGYNLSRITFWDDEVELQVAKPGDALRCQAGPQAGGHRLLYVWHLADLRGVHHETNKHETVGVARDVEWLLASVFSTDQSDIGDTADCHPAIFDRCPNFHALHRFTEIGLEDRTAADLVASQNQIIATNSTTPPTISNPTRRKMPRPNIRLCHCRHFAAKERSHNRMRAGIAQRAWVALGDGTSGIGIRGAVKHDATIGDREDRCQFMRHDDKGRTEVVTKIQDQSVEPSRSDRIEPGRRFIEEQQWRIERHGSRDAGAASHAAGDFRGHQQRSVAQADQSKLSFAPRPRVHPAAGR